jgi:hypothetical protein
MSAASPAPLSDTSDFSVYLPHVQTINEAPVLQHPIGVASLNKAQQC